MKGQIENLEDFKTLNCRYPVDLCQFIMLRKYFASSSPREHKKVLLLKVKSAIFILCIETHLHLDPVA